MKSTVCKNHKPRRAIRARYLRSETLPWLKRRDQLSQKLFELANEAYLNSGGEPHKYPVAEWTDFTLPTQSAYRAMAHWVLKQFDRRARR